MRDVPSLPDPSRARPDRPYEPRHLRSPRSNGDRDPLGGEGLGTGAAEDGDDEDDGSKRRRSWRRTVLEWAGVIAGGIVIALLVEAFLIQAFWIPSESMEPTLNIGDRVLVNKLSYKLHDVHRGDLIVFERPPSASTGEDGEIKDLIKRVIAVEGETVEARDGRVFVNGEPQEEGYLEPGTPTNNLARQTVPEEHVFVMGDNRANSEDSRIFGPIDEDDIIGRAFIRVLPITDIGWL
ncbi:MAG TPA: signal peptidase I [Acidimicrobiales bacterium]|nr:signal peptidase I [Acidimicrobiales bacterium]